MIYEFEHNELQVKVSVELNDNRTAMYRDFKQQAEQAGAPTMTAPSFARLLDPENVKTVKGWRCALVNPSAAAVAKTERSVANREEKRQQKKAHKKALKAANKSIKNGNRNHLGAQARYRQKASQGNFKPTQLANTVAALVRNR